MPRFKKSGGNRHVKAKRYARSKQANVCSGETHMNSPTPCPMDEQVPLKHTPQPSTPQMRSVAEAMLMLKEVRVMTPPASAPLSISTSPFTVTPLRSAEENYNESPIESANISTKFAGGADDHQCGRATASLTPSKESECAATFPKKLAFDRAFRKDVCRKLILTGSPCKEDSPLAMQKSFEVFSNKSETLSTIALVHNHPQCEVSTSIGQARMDDTNRSDSSEVTLKERIPADVDEILILDEKYAQETTQDDLLGIEPFPEETGLVEAAGEMTITKEPRMYLSYNNVVNLPPNEFRRLTGLTQNSFHAVFEFIGGEEVCSSLKYNYKRGTPRKKNKTGISLFDRLFLTLLRLRRGFSVEDLALLFNVSKTLVSDIFFVWIQLLYLQFLRLKVQMFTERGRQPASHRPPCLKAFKDYRVTIDSTEVRIQQPYHYRAQGNTFSDYKSGNVILFLVGINCWGCVSFISPGFEGSISDKDLFVNSGIMEHLHPGDVILADRGFNIQHLLDPLHVKVVIPPFLNDRPCLSPEEEILTKSVAAGRIHVERVIRKIKCFHLLKQLTNSLLPLVDQLFYVAACLVNFDPPCV